MSEANFWSAQLSLGGTKQINACGLEKEAMKQDAAPSKHRKHSAHDAKSRRANTHTKKYTARAPGHQAHTARTAHQAHGPDAIQSFFEYSEPRAFSMSAALIKLGGSDAVVLAALNVPANYVPTPYSRVVLSSSVTWAAAPGTSLSLQFRNSSEENAMIYTVQAHASQGVQTAPVPPVPCAVAPAAPAAPSGVAALSTTSLLHVDAAPKSGCKYLLTAIGNGVNIIGPVTFTAVAHNLEK